MRRHLTIITFVAVIMTVTQTAQANPLLAAASYFVLQGMNDQRQNPVTRNTVSLNPIYNVQLNGNQVGANADPKSIVSAVARGTTVIFEPGDISKVDIIGFEIQPNDPSMSKKYGLYPYPETIGKYIGFGDAKAKFLKEIQPEVGLNVFEPGNPRFISWQIPIETSNLSQKLYTVKVRVWYVQRVASGLFNMGRSTQIVREETLIKFGVVDPVFMQDMVNNVELQQALRASFGLTGGPVQISKPQYSVDPQVASQLNQPTQPAVVQTESAPRTKKVQRESGIVPDEPKRIFNLKGSYQLVLSGNDNGQYPVRVVGRVKEDALVVFVRNGQDIAKANITGVEKRQIYAEVQSGFKKTRTGDEIMFDLEGN